MENLKKFLNTLSSEELEVLQKIIGTKKTTVDDITNLFSKLLLPVNGFFQKGLSYNQILDKIASKKGIRLNNTSKISEIEKELFQQLFVIEYENLSENEKIKIDESLEKQGLDKSQITALTSLAAITTAQVSGFGVYILASSTVGAISSVMGITLPFAFYTGMSSTISLVIGPLGFLVIGYGLFRSFKNVKSMDDVIDVLEQASKGVWSFFSGDYDRTVLAFKYITSLRILKINEKEKEYLNLKEKYHSELNNKSVLDIELSRLQNQSAVLNDEIEILKEKLQIKNKDLISLSKNLKDSNHELEIIKNKMRHYEFSMNRCLDVMNSIKL